MRRTSLFALLLVALVPSALASSNVHVVAPSGAPYTQIQPAIDASMDGDVVLVKEGSYAAFTIVDKAVAVVADTGQPVRATQASITGLAVGRDVLLHRLRLDATGLAATGLQVSSCAGSVRVQASRVEGGTARIGMAVGSSPDVAAIDCVVLGGNGVVFSVAPDRNGGVAVDLASSQIALYGGELRGGVGASHCNAGSGGDALRLVASYGFAGDALLVGGQGGASIALSGGSPQTWPFSGHGGDGAQVGAGAGVPSRLEHLADQFVAGAGGSVDQVCGSCACELTVCCFPDWGGNGAPILVGTGHSADALPGSAPRLELATNPVREQGQVHLTFFGQPGDQVSLLASLHTSFNPQGTLKGVLLVQRQGAPLAQMVGTIGASGMLAVGWPVPELGAGVEARIVHLQAVHRNAAGHSALGNAVQVVELDSAF